MVLLINSAPNRKVSMSMVTSSLFNEEVMQQSSRTSQIKTLVTKNQGRSKNDEKC